MSYPFVDAAFLAGLASGLVRLIEPLGDLLSRVRTAQDSCGMDDAEAAISAYRELPEETRAALDQAIAQATAETAAWQIGETDAGHRPYH
jgi:hypothetical protein